MVYRTSLAAQDTLNFKTYTMLPGIMSTTGSITPPVAKPGCFSILNVARVIAIMRNTEDSASRWPGQTLINNKNIEDIKK